MGSEFSVISTTLNGGQKLSLLLESISDNSILPKEVIVVGTDQTTFDFSTDFAVYPFELTFITSLEKGQVLQRALGIKTSSCDLIFQLDDDLVLDPFYFQAMLETFDRLTGRCVVGAVPRYKDGEAMSWRYSESVFRSKLVRFCFFVINGFTEPQPLSVSSSGRNFPGLKFTSEDDVHNCEWLCSCMLFERCAFEEASFLKWTHRKAHFEDVVFSHSLYRIGYTLQYSYKAKAYHPYVISSKRSLSEIFGVLKAQFEVVRIFRLSNLSFLMDALCFFIISVLRRVL